MSRDQDAAGSQIARPARIAQTFTRQTDLLYILTFEDGTRLETTWNHPFYIEGKGWTEAKDLRAGDRSLVAKTGKTLELVEVAKDQLGGDVTVYNFEVEDDHTYFVGEGEVWVHNADPVQYTKDVLSHLPEKTKQALGNTLDGAIQTTIDTIGCGMLQDTDSCNNISDPIVNAVTDPVGTLESIGNSLSNWWNNITGENGPEGVAEGIVDAVPAAIAVGTTIITKSPAGAGGEVLDTVEDAAEKGAKNAAKEAAEGAAGAATEVHKPSLLDQKGATHVLDGDSPTSGGHRPGTGSPGKSEFPSSWSDDKILGEISDIATDPSVKWSKPDKKTGYITGTGTRDGIDIKVVYDTKNGRIVSGYPTNTPRNPK